MGWDLLDLSSFDDSSFVVYANEILFVEVKDGEVVPLVHGD
jgi:hypothetical protein